MYIYIYILLLYLNEATHAVSCVDHYLETYQREHKQQSLQ
jgi:hypothetical protein